MPELLPEDVAQIERETAEALRQLLAADSLSRNTVRSYESALRYWDAWHRSTYGTPLPLLEEPRQTVSTAAVAAFVVHHCPSARATDAGQLQMAMPGHVLQRMRELGAFGKRLAAKRVSAVTSAADGDAAKQLSDEVPTLATIKHRVASLRACHRYAGIEPEFADAAVVREALRSAANRADRIAPGMKRQPKQALLRESVDSIFEDCLVRGLIGVRDAALLHAAFNSGGRRRSELAAMRWEHIKPARFKSDEGVWIEGYIWSLLRTKGRQSDRADRGVLEIALVGDAKIALDQWRDELVSRGLMPQGPVWWRVRQRKKAAAPEGGGVEYVIRGAMTGKDVWALVKTWAERLGLDPQLFGAHSLRSGAATTHLEEGMSLEDASRLLDHRSLETTRRYDHRSTTAAPIIRHIANRKAK